MRCPDCSKFVSLELQDPEVNDLEVSDEGVITCSVRIVRACADCGTELKEATLDMEDTSLTEAVTEHRAEAHPESESGEAPENTFELSVEEDSVEGTEVGGGRYKKSYYGADVQCTVSCQCGHFSKSATLSDSVAASYMDELV